MAAVGQTYLSRLDEQILDGQLVAFEMSVSLKVLGSPSFAQRRFMTDEQWLPRIFIADVNDQVEG